MSGETLAGQDTPSEVIQEVQDLTPQVTGNAEAQTDGADGEKEVPVSKSFTQAELDVIVAREKAKAERKAFREAISRVSAQQAKQEPKPEAFADDEQYQMARLDHLANQRAEKLLEQREQARAAESRQEAFIEKAEKASERYPDFQTVVSNPNLPINDAMAEYIAESDEGGEVAYFLGKNPMRAAQIAQLSPVKAARELARIESELASKPKAQPSKAPDPITPVGSRGAARSSSSPSDSDDIATWMQKERERMRKR